MTEVHRQYASDKIQKKFRYLVLGNNLLKRMRLAMPFVQVWPISWLANYADNLTAQAEQMIDGLIKQFPELSDSVPYCKLCTLKAVSVCHYCFGAFCYRHQEHGDYEKHGEGPYKCQFH